MNEWIVVIAALLVASVPWLLLEVFDRARQQELRALAGKHVPQIHHRTRLQRATAAACATVGLAAVAAATGLVALPTHVVAFSVAFLTLGVTTPVAWMGVAAASRIRRVFVAQVWLAILYTVIGSGFAATDWSDPVGKASGGFLLLGSGVVGLWASARALTSEHGIPAAAGVVRQRGAITPTE